MFVPIAGLPDGVEHELRHHAARSEVVGSYLRTDWRDRIARDGDRREVKGVRRWLESKGVKPLEGDVGPLRRHLSDTGMAVACSLDHACYFDLETDSRVPFSRKEEMRLLSWAVVSHRTGEVVGDVLESDTDEAEVVLLKSFLQAIAPYDTCIAWNGERFDEEILRARSEKRGLSPDWRMWCWLDHLQAYEKYAVAATGEQKTSLALNKVAQAVVGEGKLGEGIGAKSWQTWESDPKLLLRYNEQDALLMRKIEEHTHYLRLHFAVCQVCRCLPTTRSLHANELVDGYLLRLGVEKGYRFPSKPGRDAVFDPFEGAYVMDPKPGVYENVAAVDFASLYPSVIQTWNISPETILATAEQRMAAPEGSFCIAPKTGVHFSLSEPGLFVVALDDLVGRRKAMQRQQAALPAGTPEHEDLAGQSAAFKTVINSFYGVMGSAMSRYYVRECGQAVAQAARWLTEALIEFATERSIVCIYADTDSAYLLCDTETASKLVRDFNEERVPSLLVKYGCKRNTIKLDYEKDLRRIVLVAAKRYAAAMSRYKGVVASKDAPPEIKGLEYKRGDQIRFARQLQKEAIDLLLRDGPLPSVEEAEALVLRWRTQVVDEPLKLEDVQLSQSIQKEEYLAKTPPPHVRVAAILKERGEDVSVGARIDYWIAKSDDGKLSPQPAADWDEARVDRSYYWEKRAWPPTRRLLAAALPQRDWSELDRIDGTKKRRRKGAVSNGVAEAPPAQASLFEEATLRVSVFGEEDRDWVAVWESAKAILAANPGSQSVVLHVRSAGATTTMSLGRCAGNGARRALERVFGRAAVTVDGEPARA
jgi:DNA polymerase elongation subunit (family B)